MPERTEDRWVPHFSRPLREVGLLMLTLIANCRAYHTWQAFSATIGWPALQPHAF